MPARRLRMATSYFSRLRTPRTAYTASKPAEQACNGNGKNFRRSMHWEERMKVLMAMLLAALAFGVGTAKAQDKYPSRPVKVIETSATGGGHELCARHLGVTFK